MIYQTTEVEPIVIPHHRRAQTETGFRYINGKPRFFSRVTIVSALTEKKEEVQENTIINTPAELKESVVPKSWKCW